jgi:translation initiation factor 1
MSEDPKKPFNNPFEALRERRESLPQGAAPRVPAAAPEKGPARAVVRMERKGRGGKEVTVVDQLELSGGQLEIWLKALKDALGCGGAIEGNTLVLQGDQRKRLPEILSARGVRKVIVG